MKTFTNEEAKAMRGTEFIYVYLSGNTVPAFVAEVDLEKGLTCKALSYLNSGGRPVWTLKERQLDPKNYDNLICIPVEEFRGVEDVQELMQKTLAQIAEGKYFSRSGGSLFSNMYTCNF